MTLSLPASAGLWGCSAPIHMRDHSRAWTERLGGDTVALLGEVHDNAELHARRWQGLNTVIQAGWRPTLVMEQFDTDHQALIDGARRSRPGDVAHLIEQAGRPEWDWSLYRPLIELAFEHGLVLRAGNLSRQRARRLVRGTWSAVFSAQEQNDLGLNGPAPQALQTAQERQVNEGHCGALPTDVLPGMARAQLGRDALMAGIVRDALAMRPGQGVALIAGNGHVRRDLGVPQWLTMLPPQQLWVVGFTETEPDSKLYDEVVLAAAQQREDPCGQLQQQLKSKHQAL